MNPKIFNLISLNLIWVLGANRYPTEKVCTTVLFEGKSRREKVDAKLGAV